MLGKSVQGNSPLITKYFQRFSKPKSVSESGKENSLIMPMKREVFDCDSKVFSRKSLKKRRNIMNTSRDHKSAQVIYSSIVIPHSSPNMPSPKKTNFNCSLINNNSSPILIESTPDSCIVISSSPESDDEDLLSKSKRCCITQVSPSPMKLYDKDSKIDNKDPISKGVKTMFSFGSRDVMIEDNISLDSSKLPSWLKDPSPVGDSSGSDDTDLPPVLFISPNKEHKTQKKGIEKMEVDSKINVVDFMNFTSSTNCCSKLCITPLSKELQGLKVGDSPPPFSPSLPTLGSAEPLSISLPCVSPTNPSFEDTCSQISMEVDNQEESDETVPPYMQDLVMLIHRRGGLSMKHYQTPKRIELFTELQISTVENHLTMYLASTSQCLSTATEYLSLITSLFKMPSFQSLHQLWTTLLQNKDVSSKTANNVLKYFHQLLVLHPPYQDMIVRDQYMLLLKAIGCDELISLLWSEEEWKFHMLEFIMGILLIDYWHLSQNSSSTSPLFHSLFWRPKDSHHINQLMRKIVKYSIASFSPSNSTNIMFTKMEVCSQLLFLLYTECPDISQEICIQISSLNQSSKLNLYLSFLLPMKLRRTITNSINHLVIN